MTDCFILIDKTVGLHSDLIKMSQWTKLCTAPLISWRLNHPERQFHHILFVFKQEVTPVSRCLFTFIHLNWFNWSLFHWCRWKLLRCSGSHQASAGSPSHRCSVVTCTRCIRWVTAERQFDEGNGSELLTELLEDDDSSQQGQVLQSEDTATGEHR